VLFGAFEAGDEATVRFHIVAVNEAAPASGTASAKSAPASSSE
jgi:transcription elongation GreA/GreB family factor